MPYQMVISRKSKTANVTTKRPLSNMALSISFNRNTFYVVIYNGVSVGGGSGDIVVVVVMVAMVKMGGNLYRFSRICKSKIFISKNFLFFYLNKFNNGLLQSLGLGTHWSVQAAIVMYMSKVWMTIK